jgi:hypothetical protein
MLVQPENLIERNIKDKKLKTNKRQEIKVKLIKLIH